MPKLDQRLIAVTKQIRADVHADIGSDHGGLLVSLIKSGRIQRGIAIENHNQPFRNSVNALDGLPADVRFGDGLAVLKTGEADSLSICGMGAVTMRSILSAYPERIPRRVTLQPNRKPELIRDWAFHSGFHLCDEQAVEARLPYVIMTFERADPDMPTSRDPAYEDLDQASAIMFGPLFLKRQCEMLKRRLVEEQVYWEGFHRLEPPRAARLRLIKSTLKAFER